MHYYLYLPKEKEKLKFLERKNKLLNLYLISKNFMSCVSEDERLFLKRKFNYNWTAEDLAIEYNVSPFFIVYILISSAFSVRLT